MSKQTINIAITGLNNTDNPGPGVPVIRGIRESQDLDVKIIGMAYENLEPGIYMPGITDITYLIPYPSAGTKVFLNRIMEIHERERIDLIIPNFDAELYTFIKSEKLLAQKGIRTFLPSLNQLEERSKSNLPAFGEKYGIRIPKSREIVSLIDIPSLREDFDYPLLVKGKFYDAYLAYNSEQVITHFNKISAKWGLPVIIQEFIKGTEVNVVALGDGTGRTVAAVSMRKQYITDKGKAWGGITIDDSQMMEITRDIIAKTRWKGGMELEMIKTSSGEYFLIEINPRIPAWVYLAVGAGQNIPEYMVKMAMGENVPTSQEYQVGKMFIRYSWDMLGDIGQFEKISMDGELQHSDEF
ncbi:ATP-grasp domain-containing protein [Geofilum rubicundum]|uniref:Similar to Biotin carboxylase n=1 Tax=Geofilum rubicundum JCM 15548 TaxID=1236989 RepID=A0A0E9LVT9_9BACT|nr:ATP-grasp domain-containing protein [Geofilum rubicundum]GAO28975.1 similar to Biotin carboxylase [Geofilum rubicundum JCM 15548]